MKITKRQLRKIIRESFILEQPEEKEDSDFDPDELAGINIPAPLKKLLDPDITAVKFMDLDQKLDASGNINHQAIAIAAFVLSYSDNDEKQAKQLLRKTMTILPKILKAQQASQEKTTSDDGGETGGNALDAFKVG